MRHDKFLRVKQTRRECQIGQPGKMTLVQVAPNLISLWSVVDENRLTSGVSSGGPSVPVPPDPVQNARI